MSSLSPSNDIYIDVPLDTDPQDLLNDCYTYLASVIPGWTPATGNLDVWLLMAISSIAAETRDVASLVPASIFRWFGANIVGVVPIDEAQATATTTWTMVDTNGYTIPAGTQVAIPISGSSPVPFITTVDTIITPGSNSVTGVEIKAVDAGTDANNIGTVGAPVQLLDVLTFVSSVTLDALPVNGADAELDADYLNRLAAELQLLAPRPILASDFAVYGRNVAGVYRVAALDLYDPDVAASFTANTTSGSPNLTSASSTAALAVGQAVTGTGVPAGSHITAISGTTVTISANATATATGVTISTTDSYNNPRTVTVAGTDINGAILDTAHKASLLSYLEAAREVNFVVHVIDPTVNSIDVTTSVKALPDSDTTAVQTAVQNALGSFLSPLTWGNFPGENPQDWTNIITLRYLALVAAVGDAPGVEYVESLTFGLHGGALAAADLILSGAIPLVTAGTITVTVDA